jgi:hypothetical protein
LNLARLGLRVRLVGSVGDDPAGHDLEAILRDQAIGIEGIVKAQSRPTTTKTLSLMQNGNRRLGRDALNVPDQVAIEHQIAYEEHLPIAKLPIDHFEDMPVIFHGCLLRTSHTLA